MFRCHFSHNAFSLACMGAVRCSPGSLFPSPAVPQCRCSPVEKKIFLVPIFPSIIGSQWQCSPVAIPCVPHSRCFPVPLFPSAAVSQLVLYSSITYTAVLLIDLVDCFCHSIEFDRQAFPTHPHVIILHGKSYEQLNFSVPKFLLFPHEDALWISKADHLSVHIRQSPSSALCACAWPWAVMVGLWG